MDHLDLKIIKQNPDIPRPQRSVEGVMQAMLELRAAQLHTLRLQGLGHSLHLGVWTVEEHPPVLMVIQFATVGGVCVQCVILRHAKVAKDLKCF